MKSLVISLDDVTYRLIEKYLVEACCAAFSNTFTPVFGKRNARMRGSEYLY